jgi:hypothetical protein
MAVLPGQAVAVQLTGSQLAGVKQLWTNAGFPTALAEGVPENGTKNDQVTFQITPPADAPVGIYALRVVSPNGTSPLRMFLVDDLPTAASPGSNVTAAQAHPVSTLTGVEGSIANLTTQFFKLSVTSGQTVSFEVLARRIGSPLDPMLRVLDLRGREISFADDTPGLVGDCQTVVTFPSEGEYLVELRDVRFQGGFYRLRIGDFPCAASAVPLAVQRGVPTAVTLSGLSTDGAAAVAVSVPADSTALSSTVSARRPNGHSSGFTSVGVSPRPQAIEQEPNQQPDQATLVLTTSDWNGRFDRPGDVDCYRFAAKQGETWTLTGVTRTAGSPADLQLKLLKSDGAQVAAVEDVGTEEGRLTVTIPADGEYVLVVEELSRRGGPALTYRVMVDATFTAFRLALSSDTANIPAGGSLALTVTAARNGVNDPIELSVVGLPAGVTSSRSVIGPGRNDAVLVLSSAADVPAGALQLVRVVGTAVTAGQPRVATADFAAVVSQRFAGLRHPLPAVSYDVGLSVGPAPGFSWLAEPAEIVLARDVSTSLLLKVQRGAGLDEAVAVAVLPPQNGVIPQLALGLKNIDKGANQIDLAVTAAKDCPLGDFTVGLTGTLKQGDRTVVQPVAIRIRVAEPLTVSAEVPNPKLTKGGTATIKVKVQRNPSLPGPVTLAFTNLPAGVTAAPLELPAEASELDVVLTAAADAAAATVPNVTISATVKQGDKTFQAAGAPWMLTVE